MMKRAVFLSKVPIVNALAVSSKALSRLTA
jgi:hypothetical protein